MNLQNLKLKASTLCAGGTLLVLGGFMTVNLAGCGGGGGSSLTTAPTPRSQGVTFRILQQDSSASRGGTVTLTGNGQTQTANADSTGVATFSNVTAGTYTATFTAFDNAGAALPATTRPVIITSAGAQSYTLVQGDTGGGAFTITGRVVANPDDGDLSTANCDAQSQPITASVLISVRDLNAINGTPIIAQAVRPLQADSTDANLRGRYTISLPFRPRSFRVEVSPDGTNGAPFAGISATTTFVPTVTTVSSVDVCTNLTGRAPAPAVTPIPTATATQFGGGGFPTPIGTSTPIGGGGGGQATSTPIPTNTSVSTPTPVATNTAIPGSQFTAVPSTTFTPIPNQTSTIPLGTIVPNSGA